MPLSQFLHRDLVSTAYVTSTFILCVGVSAIFWNPISNIYGRRPIYIGTVAIATAMSAASGASQSYGELIAFRCPQRLLWWRTSGSGSATVRDMFFAHERGF